MSSESISIVLFCMSAILFWAACMRHSGLLKGIASSLCITAGAGAVIALIVSVA